MKTEEFGNFLRNVKRQGKQTIDSRLSNCRTIEEHEGDLDQHFDQGRVDQLLDRLTYSTEDQRLGVPKRHRVPIGGNVRTRTATLRNAARLYFEFRQDPHPHASAGHANPPPVRSSRASRAGRSAKPWPKWEQAGDADILQLVRVLTPLVRFLHPDIVAAVVEDNREHSSDWRAKFKPIGIEPDIYLWDGSPCAFPGIRRYIGKERASYRQNLTPRDGLRLDDNNYPKQLWAFVFTGEPFQNKGPGGYHLAHLADHKEYKNRWREEFGLDSAAEPGPLFGLYTSPANAAYVPKNFLRPTDVVYSLRALLLRRAYALYGSICRLAPPPLVEKQLTDAAWHPDRFDWCDPVGDMDNVREFLKYRQDQVNQGLETRLAGMRSQTSGDPMPRSETDRGA